MPLLQGVNDPGAAPLASDACSPALLAAAAASCNQVASFRVFCDPAAEFASLLGGPDFRRVLDEDGRLRNRAHDRNDTEMQ